MDVIIISQHGLLRWINGLLDGRYQKLEDLCNGVAFCQLLHTLRPDAINLDKVKFSAKIEDEYKQNFRILQSSLNRMGVNIEIPIETLISGQSLDIQDFARWFQNFFKVNQALVEGDADDEKDTKLQYTRDNSKKVNAKSRKLSKKLVKGSKRRNNLPVEDSNKLTSENSLEELLEGEIQLPTWQALVNGVENLASKNLKPMDDRSNKQASYKCVEETTPKPRNKSNVPSEDELQPDPIPRKFLSTTLINPSGKSLSQIKSQDAETQWDFPNYDNSKLSGNQCTPKFWHKVYGSGSIHMSVHSLIDDSKFREFIESIDSALTRKINHMLKKALKNKSFETSDIQDKKMNCHIDSKSYKQNEYELSNKSVTQFDKVKSIVLPESCEKLKNQIDNVQQVEGPFTEQTGMIDDEAELNKTTEEIGELLYNFLVLEKNIEHYYDKIQRINNAWKCLLNIPHCLFVDDTTVPKKEETHDEH